MNKWQNINWTRFIYLKMFSKCSKMRIKFSKKIHSSFPRIKKKTIYSMDATGVNEINEKANKNFNNIILYSTLILNAQFECHFHPLPLNACT